VAETAAETTLSVEVQGAEAVNALAAALANLNQQAAQVQRTVSAAGARAGTAAGTREANRIRDAAIQDYATFGERLANRFGYAIHNTLRTGFDVLRSTASVAGRSLLSFSGTLGQVAAGAGATSTAIVAMTLAVTGLGIPLLNLIAGFKLLRSSFGWAQEAADEQLRVAARTQRFYPQMVGAGVEAAENEVRARMGMSAALFGNAAESIQEQVTRKFTEFRMGRGLRGERDIFARWGITPESVQTAERMMGRRFDVSSWLEAFIMERERLQRMLPGASPEAAEGIRRRLAMLSDDTVKMFGAKFSDMVNTLSTQDAQRLKTNIEAAIPLGNVVETSEQARRRAVDFNIALESLKGTFTNIIRGVGADVQPTITTFLTELNRRMLDATEGGEGLGRAFRDLASTMANRAWEELKNLMNYLKPERVRNWIEIISSWNPAETLETVKSVFNTLASFGSAIKGMVDSINALERFLPDWLKRKLGFASMQPQPAERPADAEGPAEGAPAAEPQAPAAPAMPEGFERGFMPGRATPPPAVARGQQYNVAPGVPGAAGERGASGAAAAPLPLPPPTVSPGAPAAGPPAATEPTAPAVTPSPPAAPATPAPVTPVTPAPSSPGGAAPGAPGWRERLREWLPNFGAPARPLVTPPAAPPAPVTPAPGATGGASNWFQQMQQPAMAMMAPTTRPAPQHNAAVEALKASAAGSALGTMTDVQSTASGDTLTMKTSYTAGADEAMAQPASWRGALPGMGMLEFMQQDAEQGHPTRTYLREMLGIPDPGEPAPWQQDRGAAAELTAPFADRFGTWGTGGSLTAEDGYQFGTAAAESIRDGLEGVHIPGGYADTSRGVAPRTAPKPTGGDTATEA